MIDVVLVLADADRLRIDLHELRERILQTACDGHGSAQTYVQLRQFLRGELRCRIDRRTRFRHDDFRELRHIQALDQLRSESIGLTRGRAVADADQLDLMLLDEYRERMQRTFQVVAGRERIHRRRIEHLAGAIDDGHFHAGTDARIESHRDARPGRRGQEQILQIAAEHTDRLLFRTFAQSGEQLRLELPRKLHLPGPAHGLLQPCIAGAPLIRNPVMRGDLQFAVVERGNGRGLAQLFGQFQRESQNLFAAAAVQRERAVRRNVLDRFAIVEVIAKLRARLFLAFDDRRDDHAVILQMRTQVAEQLRIFGELLGKDLARTIERRFDIRHTRVVAMLGLECLAQVLGCFDRRGQRGIVQQRIGQGFEPGFARNLSLGAAFRLVRRIQVFQTLLAVGRLDALSELRRKLLLFLDALQNRGTTFLELAQIDQPLAERSQLRIVEAARDLLAISRNERDRRAFVEQLDGSIDLDRLDGEFGGNARFDRREHSITRSFEKGGALCSARR